MCYVITLETPPIITHANKAPPNLHVRVKEREKEERKREAQEKLSIIYYLSPLIFFFSCLSSAYICSFLFCCFFHSFHSHLLPFPLDPFSHDWLLPDTQVVVSYCTTPPGITKASLNVLLRAYFRKNSPYVGNLVNGWKGEQITRNDISRMSANEDAFKKKKLSNGWCVL